MPARTFPHVNGIHQHFILFQSFLIKLQCDLPLLADHVLSFDLTFCWFPAVLPVFVLNLFHVFFALPPIPTKYEAPNHYNYI